MAALASDSKAHPVNLGYRAEVTCAVMAPPALFHGGALAID
ncbi:hypothetical protein DAD186_18910 [Dermabacter vaginalis]|uniref:Uncharacterized protein n=1 Tax=Dermabacter vaginalis TaxID=1630135 RepID=A0A1B0ZKB4_9MICO|nr:hypothetical protein DAD186_18910 [Dermabacter vaginalis]